MISPPRHTVSPSSPALSPVRSKHVNLSPAHPRHGLFVPKLKRMMRRKSDTPSSGSSEGKPSLPRRCSEISSVSMMECSSRSSVPSLVFLERSDHLSSSLSRLAISRHLCLIILNKIYKSFLKGSLNSSAGDLVTSPAISTGHRVG